MFHWMKFKFALQSLVFAIIGTSALTFKFRGTNSDLVIKVWKSFIALCASCVHLTETNNFFFTIEQEWKIRA